MIHKYIFLTIAIFSALLRADILYTENFDEDGVWPDGWTHDEYIDPDTGEESVSNWRVDDRSQPTEEGFTPPAAVFWWSPAVPLPRYDTDTWYSLSLQSPDIDVGDNDAVLVKFDISLDFYNASAHTNGMIIEANGGNGWVEMLKYEIGPGAGFVEINFRTESFTTDVEGGTLQLRWTAYGTDSYYIDGWFVDNIRVISLPKLSSVHIESNNATDNQTAIEGDEVTLTLTSEVTLTGPPYIQVNGSETVVIPQGSNTYTSTHIVSDTDDDGPVTFSIDFTSLDGGIDGATVNNTTDNSKVIIDRTPPPPFSVGETVTTLGGNVFEGKWNSTNTSLELEVSVPEDSSVIEFNYFQGNSISFDGSDDRVTIPSNSLYQFSDQFTVELWVKPNSYQDYEGAISYGMDAVNDAGFAIAYFATGWCFYLKTTDSIPDWPTMIAASAPTAQWTHLAGTYDGSKAKLYRNGILMDEQNMTGNIEWDNVADLYIGYFNSSSSNKYFDGQIDEVRLWNTVRTGLQIKGNKSITLQGNETGLVGYWRADEPLGITLSDMTANDIDGTLSGATFVTLNSPINFSTPVYDNTVIIGSNYQLRTKMGLNDFQTFDDLQEITNADFVATTKTISGAANSFTSVNGYQHNETALISALLYDQSGNFSLGDTSAMSLEIDLIANDPTSASITSDNTNSSYAKTGDMVTINMSYDEDIISTSSSIESNAATDTDLGSEQFKAEYTLTGSEPEGVLDFVIDATDYMGNPGSYSLTTDGSQVTYDKTPPELTYVNISSNNADTAWAKVDDFISIAFTSNEVISLDSLALIPSVAILGQTASVTDLQNNKFSAVYVPTDSDSEGEAAFEIQFSDLSGNDGTPVTASTNNTKVIFDRTPPTDFTVGLLTPTGGNQVAGIWNLTNTGMDVIIPVANDTTLKNGTVQLYGKIGSNDFGPLGSISTILSTEINTDKTISVTGELIEGLTGFAEGEIIYVKAEMTDRPGNSTEGSQSATEILIDETPASITPIAIISNNDNTALAKVGDTVTVSFTTSEILIDTTVSISGHSVTITGLGSNQFKAEYAMAEGDPEGVIEFEISFIDVQGNPLTGTNATTDASEVTFDKTKPTLDPATITSDNSCSSGAIAKAENIVTINFTSLETLLSTFSIVMGDTVSVTDLGSSQYKIDHQLTAEDSEGDVSFLIRVTDLVGNVSEDITTTTDGSNVEFDNTLPLLTNVHIESNNNYSSIAVLGDLTTLTFEADEPLSSTTVVISSSSVTATESNGVYTANYTIQESDIAVGGFLSFAIDFADCPGNIGLTDSTTTDESFVSIDIGPPEMVSVKIFSTNQDSSWSKIDDSVSVYFVVNEPLKLDGNPASSLKIGGNSVDMYNVENTNYQGDYVMTDSDTEGEVSFEIS
nr:LamG domain-containing protein [Candidatus Neomarinimicrobiota bacterium]